jgi:hypothetical protein
MVRHSLGGTQTVHLFILHWSTEALYCKNNVVHLGYATADVTDVVRHS